MQQLSFYDQLRKYAFKSKSYPLSKNFVEYMISDDFMIPEKYVNERMKQDDIDEVVKFEEDFEKLKEFFDQCINEFGIIFMKIDGCNPKDVSNMVPDLKFQIFEQVLLAFKFSDLIHDYIQTNDQQSYFLNFKKYHRLNKGMEFRLFYRNKKLKGISQKNLENFYPFLKKFYQEIGENAIIKFNEEIKGIISFEDFSLDIYIDIPPNYKIKITDINQKNYQLLLFTEEELKNEMIFKSLDNEEEIQRTMYSQHFPQEFFDPKFQNKQNLDDYIDIMKNENRSNQLLKQISL